MFYRPKEIASPDQMLSAAQIAALSARVGSNADRAIQTLLAKSGQPAPRVKKQPAKPPKTTRRGRPAKRILNPFCELLGPTTAYGRYPFFTQEIIEGIARLDWHDRPIGMGGSSKPLSVRSLMVILETAEEVTADNVAAIIGTQTRQAQRYVKAIELAMPFLMKSRPKRLVFEMDLPEDEFVNAIYRQKLRETCSELLDDLPPPSLEDLAKLRQDLGEDAFYPDRGINAAYYKEDAPTGDHRSRLKQQLRPPREGVVLAVA
ncbi:hypothetical protein RHP75_12325 [Pseudomonas sp. SG20056]|uniref:hypothetical protein n=1 Tax=Pseudomonas sp. SG20056 TaxID=3074146 RepID=UPI00287FBBF1|nr:hypothetical protein [Pseudomonas sp. SG20056]WNF45174.1 hypothetical protein RHP75_12325 [Pseudomonas sp. SG20056]